MSLHQLVVLDRDGVINEDSDEYVKSVSELKPVAGSIDGIARLCRAGFKIAVVTNQSGLARGLYDVRALNKIHNKLRDYLAPVGGHIEMILFCPHLPTEDCGCRKPSIGLFCDLSERLGFALRGVPYVGDSISDVDAARGMEMQPILVRTGKGKQTLVSNRGRLEGVPIFEDLNEVSRSLIVSWGNQ